MGDFSLIPDWARRRLDVTYRPEGDGRRFSLLPPSDLRVYESDVPGYVTLILFDGQYVDAGIRLDREQVEDLYARLGNYLEQTEVSR